MIVINMKFGSISAINYDLNLFLFFFWVDKFSTSKRVFWKKIGRETHDLRID